MSKQGGYKIIDLADLPLSGSATVLVGIHAAIEKNFRKPILLSGINYGNVEKADCYVQFSVDSGSFVGDAYNKRITITADDEITIEDIPTPSAGVDSVNGQTGVVVLDADDILCDNSTSVQDNLERIDEAVEGVVDDLATKLDATKSAVSTVGGLVVPTAAPSDPVLVGVGTGNDQIQVAVGNGLILTGVTSPYTLEATGGSGDSPVFIVEYETTSLDEIDEAYEAGKVLFLKDNDEFYPLTKVEDDGGRNSYLFRGLKGDRYSKSLWNIKVRWSEFDESEEWEAEEWYDAVAYQEGDGIELDSDHIKAKVDDSTIGFNIFGELESKVTFELNGTELTITNAGDI